MSHRPQESLKESIRKSKVHVDMDESVITIARSAHNRGETLPTNTLGEYAHKRLFDETELGYEAKFWKKKCEDIYEERNALEKSLLEKLGAVLEKYDELKQQAADTHVHDAIHQKIKLYEILTGTTIDSIDGIVFDCKVKNATAKKGAIFSMSLNGNNMAVQPRANASLLPSYLQEEEIIFEMNQAPVLMKDTLQCVFGEDDSEDKEVHLAE